jgi:hypothetical protein
MPLFLQPLSPQYVAFRIALGVKVFCSGCKALLNNTGLLELSFLPTQVDSASGLSPREKIKIDLSKEVKEFKYYIAGGSRQNEEASLKSSQDPTQRMSFLAMRVDLSMSSNSSYAEHYQPSAGDPSNSFILVVFGCETEFRELLQVFQRMYSLHSFFCDQAELTMETVDSLNSVFGEEAVLTIENETTTSGNMIASPASRKKEGFLAGKNDADILLSYPFDGDQDAIEKAAEGLKEAMSGGRFKDGSSSKRVLVESMKTLGRRHFTTVRVEDYQLLEPTVYLNDALIDFWMKWYVHRAGCCEC